jgi:hypothetical protein
LAASSREPIVHGSPGQASTSLTANGTPASGRPRATRSCLHGGGFGEVGDGVERGGLLDQNPRRLGQLARRQLAVADEPGHLDGVPTAVVGGGKSTKQ